MRASIKKRLKSRIRLECFQGKQFIQMVYVVLKRHNPNFDELVNTVPDHRRRKIISESLFLDEALPKFPT